MSEAYPANSIGGERRRCDGAAVARVSAEWLGLSAAPIFAVMALLTAAFGGGEMATICLSAQHASPLSGMVPMYLLMSAFHLAPWLKLLEKLV